MNPVLVETTRGPLVENRHRAVVAVVDPEGKVVAAWGDIERPVFPRSAAKPFQALPLIETGAADRLGLSEAEIALACASHSGEPVHTTAVAAWLDRLGLSVADLECGAHFPMDPSPPAGLVPSALHNNCSGKHAGMLATARHMGEPTKGYIEPDHPVQRRAREALGRMAGIAGLEAPFGVDGCGIPAAAIPLKSLALAYARLGAGQTEATRRIASAMMAEPLMVGGTGRFDSLLMAAAPGLILCKGGAEGVHGGALPELGLGFALKIDDGAKRAEEALAAALLARHVPDLPLDLLARFNGLPVWNAAGREVGATRAVNV